MFILVTGISGLDRKTAFSKLPPSPEDRVIDLGESMLSIAEKRQMTLDEHNMLHAGRDTLAALRAAAIAKANIRCGALKMGDQPFIISTHSIFSRVDGLAEGLSIIDLQEISPVLWITLIDGPQSIEERLRKHQAEYLQHRVEDVVKWQEFEVFFSHHLAGLSKLKDGKKIPHYVVPINQPDVLARICEFVEPTEETGEYAIGARKFETVYVSYPMSHVTTSAHDKIKQFIKQLSEHFIVFDPGSIESSHGTKTSHSSRDRQAIGSHTIVRDLDWFIGINADQVVAYWPEVIFSSGMSDELRYAFEIGKQTVLVTERTDGKLPTLSPFMTYKASVFWSSEEYFNFLNLDKVRREIYAICQTTMAELLRSHETEPALKIELKAFVKTSEERVKLKQDKNWPKDWQSYVSEVANNVFQSWEPYI